MQNIPFCEKYKPKSFDELLIIDLVKDKIKSEIKNNELVNNLIFVSIFNGTCKSTTISCLKNIVKEKNNKNILEIRLIDKNVDILENIKDFCKKKTEKKKVIIIDEFDTITEKYQDYIDDVMNKYKNITFIFACNNLQKISECIQNKTVIYNFNKITAISMLDKIQEILKLEDKKLSKAEIRNIIHVANGDLKKMLNLLETTLFGSNKLYELINYPIEEELRKILEIEEKEKFIIRIEELLDNYNFNNIISSFIDIYNKDNKIEELEILHTTYLIINKHVSSKLQMINMFLQLYDKINE